VQVCVLGVCTVYTGLWVYIYFVLGAYKKLLTLPVAIIPQFVLNSLLTLL
jgi:hypothetical protein